MEKTSNDYVPLGETQVSRSFLSMGVGSAVLYMDRSQQFYSWPLFTELGLEHALFIWLVRTITAQ